MVNAEKLHSLNNIKVLMIAPCLGKYGGIETFCLTLIEDLIKRGASVQLLRRKVLGFEDNGSIQENENEVCRSWTKEEYGRYKSEFINPRDRVIQLAVKECDIVHLHNPIVEGVWEAKKRNKPCVMTIYNWRRKGLNPRLLAWKWAVSQVDRRWYISEFVWDTWETKRRKHSSRLPVVSRMPKEDYPPHMRRGFIFAGRWIPNKGIRVLVEAYRRISPDPDVWPLIMIGDGPLKKEVIDTIESKKIKGIKIIGFVSEEEKHNYIRHAKWMVTPPNTKEDLGLTPLEARSVGVPCIASTDGGVVETAGRHALFCKPGDVESLKKLLSKAICMDNARYNKMSKLAKEGIENYVRPLCEYSKQYLKLIKKNEY